jgi:hypothetical protein
MQVDVQYAAGSGLEFVLRDKSGSKEALRLRAETAALAAQWTRILKRVSGCQLTDDIDGSEVDIRIYGKVWRENPNDPSQWEPFCCVCTPDNKLLLVSTETGRLEANLPFHSLESVRPGMLPMSVPYQIKADLCFTVSDDGHSSPTATQRTWMLAVDNHTELRKWTLGLRASGRTAHQVGTPFSRACSCQVDRPRLPCSRPPALETRRGAIV